MLTEPDTEETVKEFDLNNLINVIDCKLNQLMSNRPHLCLVIDEIDAFSKSDSTHLMFQEFLKKLLIRKTSLKRPKSKKKVQNYLLTVVGIANSVELFKGELRLSQSKQNPLEQTKFMIENEIKLLFKPYTRENLASILLNLYLEQLQSLGHD